ncbi:MAG: RNA methyltransferase, partial [Chitinophagaceae bacterium]
TIMKWQSDLLAIPKVAYDSVLQLQQNMYIKKAGVNFGTVIRQELIPSHELVISTIYSGNIPELEVDQETALNYLRRKDINMDTFIHGWAVVTYLSVRIGLVKILPNRINNYYPKDWRILNK